MNSLDISTIAQQLRSSRVFEGKRSIRKVSTHFSKEQNSIRNGDDAAAIPDGDGYLLLAAEGIVPDIVKSNPYLAGRCAVLTNVNDIYSMGGRPTALVNIIGAGEDETAAAICRGISDNAARYQLPVVGGHILRIGSGGPTLAAAILGRARRLITSFDALPGDRLVLVSGPRGHWLAEYGFWNCTLEEDDEALVANLDLIPQASEMELVKAGKDVSMAGIAGTAVMLAEGSGVGMRLDLEHISPPDGVDLVPWMLAYFSYGFLLSVHPAKLDDLRSLFFKQQLTVATIGSVQPGSEVLLVNGSSQAMLWDWKKEPFTGFGHS
jgi:hypothetical protein